MLQLASPAGGVADGASDGAGDVASSLLSAVKAGAGVAWYSKELFGIVHSRFGNGGFHQYVTDRLPVRVQQALIVPLSRPLYRICRDELVIFSVGAFIKVEKTAGRISACFFEHALE